MAELGRRLSNDNAERLRCATIQRESRGTKERPGAHTSTENARARLAGDRYELWMMVSASAKHPCNLPHPCLYTGHRRRVTAPDRPLHRPRAGPTRGTQRDTRAAPTLMYTSTSDDSSNGISCFGSGWIAHTAVIVPPSRRILVLKQSLNPHPRLRQPRCGDETCRLSAHGPRFLCISSKTVQLKLC
jgi:hypothetical protein